MLKSYVFREGTVYTDEISGVTISGITSFVGTMPGQASELYSNNMFNLMEELCQIPKHHDNNANDFAIDLNDEIAKGAVVIDKKQLLWLSYDERVKREEEQKKAAAIASPPAIGSREKEVKIVIDKQKAPEQKESMKERLIEEKRDIDTEVTASMDILSSGGIVGGMTVLAIGLAYSTDFTFMLNFIIFTLALIIGYIVVWGVDPLLHASLMSETNAISGIICIGAMLQLYGYNGSFMLPNICGALALFFASINVFGGFLLTDKMLGMISC